MYLGSVVVRKAYGAGLYAMCGPGFEPDCSITATAGMIAVMGPEAAVNAVFARKIAEQSEDTRDAAAKRAEYADDVDIVKPPASLSWMPLCRVDGSEMNSYSAIASIGKLMGVRSVGNTA